VDCLLACEAWLMNALEIPTGEEISKCTFAGKRKESLGAHFKATPVPD
jgi:hypothetical protein